jgi:hypothetical protein
LQRGLWLSLSACLSRVDGPCHRLCHRKHLSGGYSGRGRAQPLRRDHKRDCSALEDKTPRPMNPTLRARRRTTVRAADLPTDTWPELKDKAIRGDQLPVRRIVFSLASRWPHVQQGAVRELAPQLACLSIDVGIIEGAADQVGGIGWRPLGILRRKTPEMASRILDLNVKNLGIGNSSVDDLPAHRAQDVERRSVKSDCGCH